MFRLYIYIKIYIWYKKMIQKKHSIYLDIKNLTVLHHVQTCICREGYSYLIALNLMTCFCREFELFSFVKLCLFRHVHRSYAHMSWFEWTSHGCCFNLMYPACSIYGIFTYIYHRFKPNAGKYSIHGASGYEFLNEFWHRRQANIQSEAFFKSDSA